MEQRLSRSSMSFTILLSLLLAFSCSSSARKDSGDYWKGVMKDEPMPAALEDLFSHDSASSSQLSLVKKPNCHHDVPTTTSSSSSSGEQQHDSQEEKYAFGNRNEEANKTFEPRLTVSSYHEDVPVEENFEPRPNVSAYGN